jgi:hypothetical protein
MQEKYYKQKQTANAGYVINLSREQQIESACPIHTAEQHILSACPIHAAEQHILSACPIHFDILKLRHNQTQSSGVSVYENW